jgi:CBS domain-containing protein
MPPPHNAHSTPLIALETIALDTETTGLDAKVARIVEIAALRVSGERVLTEKPFLRILNPGIPIPAAAAKIHGLTDTKLQNAPRFAEIAADLDEFLDGMTVIGHDIGYDLTILAREYALAGRTWRVPRALDVARLARVAAPDLAGYSLDALCDWQQIRIERRHRALPDARAAAQLFVHLIPLLRARNIRTLAEVEAACANLPAEAARRARMGWVVPARQADIADSAPILGRLDSYPYRHRVRDVMSALPVTAAGTLAPREALDILLDKRISSVLVAGSDGRTGIVTERDLLRALRNEVPGKPSPRLEDIMSHPLKTVAEEAFVYRAIGRMERLGIRHLAVDNRRSEIVGIVTSRDLLRQRATTAIALGDEIDNALDVAALGAAWTKLPWVVHSLLDENVDPESITQVIGAEICAVTARAAQIAERQLATAGKGTPPVPYAVMVLGSGGRGESLLSADQDNAIVYASGKPGGPEDRWFEDLAVPMADILDQIGIAYCRGGVMAKNAACRHSVDLWKKEIDGWIERAEPADLLSTDIFFDGVGVHGHLALADEILDYAYERGRRTPHFTTLLSALAGDWQSPVTLFGGFRKDADGRVDLKKGGLLPIFTGARTLAIMRGIRERSTVDRLKAASSNASIEAESLEAIISAHRMLLRLVLEQQLADIDRGVAVSNSVEIARLSRSERKKLHEALSTIQLLSLILR